MQTEHFEKVRFHRPGLATFSCRSQRFGLDRRFSALQLWIFTVAVAVLLTFGCATTHATLDIVAPSTAKAGTPFTLTVMVLYQGKPDTVINSGIHFTSSDPSAVLPGDYYFTSADAGSHTWTNGVTLITPGNQTIGASIIMGAGINGTTAIAVSP